MYGGGVSVCMVVVVVCVWWWCECVYGSVCMVVV